MRFYIYFSFTTVAIEAWTLTIERGRAKKERNYETRKNLNTRSTRFSLFYGLFASGCCLPENRLHVRLLGHFISFLFDFFVPWCDSIFIACLFHFVARNKIDVILKGFRITNNLFYRSHFYIVGFISSLFLLLLYLKHFFSTSLVQKFVNLFDISDSIQAKLRTRMRANERSKIPYC